MPTTMLRAFPGDRLYFALGAFAGDHIYLTLLMINAAIFTVTAMRVWRKS